MAPHQRKHFVCQTVLYNLFDCRYEDPTYNFLGAIDLIVAPHRIPPGGFKPAIYSLYLDKDYKDGMSRILAGTDSALLAITHPLSKLRQTSVVLGQLGESGMTFDTEAKIGRVTGIIGTEEGEYLISDATYHFVRHFVESNKTSVAAVGQPGQPGYSDGKLNTPGELIRNNSDSYLILCKDALHVYNFGTSLLALLLHSPSVPGLSDVVFQSGSRLSADKYV